VQTPLPPAIGVNARGANLELRIETLAGATYVLQSTPELKPPVVWTPVLTNSGTGGTITNTVPLSSAAAPQFFRYLAR
jgi:hypothetical protein